MSNEKKHYKKFKFVVIKQNGKVIARYRVNPFNIEKYWEYAVDIAGSLWDGENTFTVDAI